MNTDDLPVHISWFPNQGVEGQPALGDPETITWGNFTGICTWWRREEATKDGPCFIPARFRLEADGRHIRRLGRNVSARTAIAEDIETNKLTGEVAPPLDEAINRVIQRGWAAVLYTSHNHSTGSPRYRIVVPLSEEIASELPAPEVIADALALQGVLDRSKLNPSSLFFLPSCPPGVLDHHQAIAIPGAPVDAAWMIERAGALLAARQAEAGRIADEARTEAAKRLEARIAGGFDPDDSLIERIRTHLDLDAILLAHGYDKAGGRYRHPNSQSGSFGADIKILGGIERVFSHNGTDPLHADNLPAWCDVTAIDAFDATVILDFGGDRTRAMRELAERFNLNKKAERKALTNLLFRLRRRNAPQQEIEAAAFAEGAQQGLTHEEIISVAIWVSANREAA
jgi:hypothetical protein